MIPHEFVFGPLAQDGGTVAGYTLDVLRRGQIKKLRVIQLDGTLAGFTYTLYNTAAACQADGSTLSALIADPRLYQVTPVMTVAAGKDEFASSEGYPLDGISNLALPFACMDDHDGNPLVKSATNGGSFLYLRLDVAGSGAKNFGVALTIEDPSV